ncbi:hypothetical protein FPCIR_2064 [Fusarium pseudocircinatum]|uniref:Uncharacterized protein n=1 Tax=Fusarium pseudocircinatum TaxID=56676 RepID=A0A8H5UWR8_9HYPO|nr:hypothetical protein FPCIR_2064 [Fusarium pseudocircinatum]
MLKLSKTWLIEFIENEHPGIEAQAEFFACDSNEPDHVLLKEYSRYLARSRVGRLGDTLKVNTAIGHVSFLLWSMKRESNRSYNSDIRKQMGLFVSNNLAVQEGLTKEAKPKLSASPKDVSFIVSKLYEPEYLGTFGSMRAVLSLTLSMMLIIDTRGRRGFTGHRLRPEHMCLRWEDAQFYCFQSVEDDVFDIRINLKICYDKFMIPLLRSNVFLFPEARLAKNITLDASQFKIIPLARLLPISMAFEDTLRLLINTALLDGVFGEGISSWDDLSQIRLPSHIARTVRRIQLKEELMDVPMLRRMMHHNLTKDPSK